MGCGCAKTGAGLAAGKRAGRAGAASASGKKSVADAAARTKSGAASAGCGCGKSGAAPCVCGGSGGASCGCGEGGAGASSGAAGGVAAGATRVRFRERQLLRSEDLADEQAYHLAMRRRHHLAQHGWGIVRGLRLVRSGRTVEPGMAVDGYGRELFVAEPLQIPPTAFDRLESDDLDVWLVYGRAEETTPIRGRFDCGAGRHNRWREVARLRLTSARAGINPREPSEVEVDDLPFAPHREPPDDPAREWPVYLGTVTRAATDQQPAQLPRPCATLVGESVKAPSGRARLQVGAESVGDVRRFAVEVAGAAGDFAERLSVNRAGETAVRGDATLGGDLTFREREGDWSSTPTVVDHCTPTRLSEERAANAVVFSPRSAAPEEQAAWQVYRTTVAQEGRTVRQLRFEIGHPGDKGDPTLHRLAVGSSDDAGDFQPCLTVTAGCLVTVMGDLNVEGRIVEGPVKADPTDPRFAGELINQWSRGASAANAQLPGVFTRGSELTVEVNAPTLVNPGASMNYTVVVSNSGPSTITNVYFYVSVASREGDGDVVGTDKKQAGPFSLAPGGSSQSQFTYSGPNAEGGAIEVSVTVIGVGPLSNVLSAQGQSTTEVAIIIG